MRRKKKESVAGELWAREPEAAEQAVSEKRIYTVSEIAGEVRDLIETAYKSVWVKGEVTGFRGAHSSGHMYFQVKDERAILEVALFRGVNQKLKFDIENGMELLICGRLSIYPGSSRFQIIPSIVEVAGAGAMQARIEQLKKKLAAEGLFDEAGKREIPEFPMRIALVTSPQGAAIRDFFKTTKRRFPGQNIVLFPVLVQGEAAPAQIVEAIADANGMGGFDVMVVCRGGGSAEDLMAFNDEGVARAIAASEIPVVTGIGHEYDTSIADLVSDMRASTPTHAAEIVAPSREELFRHLEDLVSRMTGFVRGALEDSSQSLDDAVAEMRDAVGTLFTDAARTLSETGARLNMLSPRKVLATRREMLGQYGGRLAAAEKTRVKGARGTWEWLGGKLHTLSPLAVLGRGYGIVFSVPDRTVVKDALKVKKGQELELKVARGIIRATAQSSEGEE
jgi:exodeoxyribonuclease VII large subunit